jgi:hypothetical protein
MDNDSIDPVFIRQPPQRPNNDLENLWVEHIEVPGGYSPVWAGELCAPPCTVAYDPFHLLFLSGSLYNQPALVSKPSSWVLRSVVASEHTQGWGCGIPGLKPLSQKCGRPGLVTEV